MPDGDGDDGITGGRILETPTTGRHATSIWMLRGAKDAPTSHHGSIDGAWRPQIRIRTFVGILKRPKSDNAKPVATRRSHYGSDAVRQDRDRRGTAMAGRTRLYGQNSSQWGRPKRHGPVGRHGSVGRTPGITREAESHDGSTQGSHPQVDGQQGLDGRPEGQTRRLQRPGATTTGWPSLGRESRGDAGRRRHVAVCGQAASSVSAGPSLQSAPINVPGCLRGRPAESRRLWSFPEPSTSASWISVAGL